MEYFIWFESSTKVDIAHVEGNVDPIRDIEIIHDELTLLSLMNRSRVSEDLFHVD